MANQRINMSKIRYILRLYSQGRSKLQISMHGGVSRNTLKTYIKLFEESGLSFSQIDELSDKELEQMFTKPSVKPLNAHQELLFSLFPDFDKQLKRKGKTRKHLWEDYKKEHPGGLGRSQFNYYFRIWKARKSPVMHMEHKAGDKMYIDFAGDKLSYTDKQTGEFVAVEVFVSILGASQLTYVEAVMSQQKEDFITACESALHYYEGVPAAVVPDNLKTAVTKSSKYEPTINETFEEFAEHYGFTILPARAYRPRDKALVEGAVKIVYNRIYTKLRDQTFYSLQQLNEAIRIALEELNNSLLTGREYSRRQLYEEVEREALSALPVRKYEFKKTHYSTVAKNGHAYLSEDKHSYSVPYTFIGKKVKFLYSRQTVEIFYNYERIAIHNRTKSPHHYTTDNDHLASSHRFVAEWNPDRFRKWGRSIHQDVELFIHKILLAKNYPEQAYKSCLGVLSFAKKVGNDRLIKACQRALAYGIYNYSIIDQILKNGLDHYNEPDLEPPQMPSHDNIRGQKYYQ
jgi:transposase